MEAVAHYTAVAMACWPRQADREKLLEINSPWKGRRNPPVAWNEKRQRVIDIDRDHWAIVDHENRDGRGPYIDLKDEIWFMKEGHPTRITDVEWDEEYCCWRFSYLTMADEIFGGSCIHLNGDLLDSRKRNLEAFDQLAR